MNLSSLVPDRTIADITMDASRVVEPSKVEDFEDINRDLAEFCNILDKRA